MPKMYQNTFADPLGELKRSPRPSSRNQGVLLLTALKKSPLADLPLPPKIWRTIHDGTRLSHYLTVTLWQHTGET